MSKLSNTQTSASLYPPSKSFQNLPRFTNSTEPDENLICDFCNEVLEEKEEEFRRREREMIRNLNESCGEKNNCKCGGSEDVEGEELTVNKKDCPLRSKFHTCHTCSQSNINASSKDDEIFELRIRNKYLEDLAIDLKFTLDRAKEVFPDFLEHLEQGKSCGRNGLVEMMREKNERLEEENSLLKCNLNEYHGLYQKVFNQNELLKNQIQDYGINYDKHQDINSSSNHNNNNKDKEIEEISSEFKQKISEKNKEIERVKEEVKRLNEEMIGKNRNIDELTSKLRSLGSSKSSTEALISELKKKINEKEKMIMNLSKELKNKNECIFEVENKSKENKEEKYETLVRELEDKNKEIQVLSTRLNSLNSESQNSKRILIENQAKLKANEEALKKYMTEGIKFHKNYKELEIKYRKATKDIDDLYKKLSDKEKEIQGMESEICGRDDEVKKLKDILKSKECELSSKVQEIQKLNKLLKERENKIQKLICENNKELTELRETVLNKENEILKLKDKGLEEKEKKYFISFNEKQYPLSYPPNSKRPSHYCRRHLFIENLSLQILSTKPLKLHKGGLSKPLYFDCDSLSKENLELKEKIRELEDVISGIVDGRYKVEEVEFREENKKEK